MAIQQDADEPSYIAAARPAMGLSWAAFALVLVALAAFIVIGSRTALWYDESNYLLLASAIKSSGFPTWFWDPTRPELFLDSPPALLYLLSLLPAETLFNPPAVRLIFAATFLAIPAVGLALYLRRDPLRWFILAGTVAVAVTTGYFAMELTQVRMDLPLAALSFASLIVVCEIYRDDQPRIRWRLVGALFALTAISYLTKYQSVCVSAVIFLWGCVKVREWRVTAAVFAAHGLGLLLALLVVAGLGWAFDGHAMHSVLDNLQHNFGRLSPVGDVGRDRFWIGGFASSILVRISLPLGLLVAARLVAPAATRADPLLWLSLALALMVALFNAVVFRMPGAGNYYLAQGALPLAYVAVRSLATLGGRRVAALAAVGTLNLLATLPIDGDPPQRWTATLQAVTQGIEADPTDAVARAISPGLAPEDIVLLDGWQEQGRQIPYWLRRPAGYGYLFTMQPADASALLQQGRVAYIVFAEKDLSFQTFGRPDWAPVWSVIAAHYRYMAVDGAPGWTVYQRIR